tara:strand:- start:168 stop:608 length:441 start_codon:yes stop_codon:yes gene_type:complete
MMVEDVVESVNINRGNDSSRRRRLFVTGFVLLILIIAMYFFTSWFSKTTGYSVGEDQKVRLAQCLSGKEIVLYGSVTCSDCDLQKRVFGSEAFRFVEYFECSDNPDYCLDAKDIDRLPAWEFKGEFYYGVKDLIELEELSGCVDPI